MRTNGTAPRLSLHALMPVAILVLLNVLHMSSVKTFVPWSQVTHIWESDLPLLAPEQDLHLYRGLIASPGLWLEDLWPMHGFSIYISFFLFLVSLLFVRIQKLVSGRRPELWAWIALLTLFMLMNGRGAIGWAGWLLCVYVCLGATMGVQSGLSLKSACQCIVGLSLATVTSGVFVASVALVAYSAFAGGFRRRWECRRKMSSIRLMGVSTVLLVSSAYGYFVFDHLFDAVAKALAFYGGGLHGLAGVATHGIASQVERITAAHVFGGGLILLFAMVFALLLYDRRVDRNFVAMIILPVLGGFFGITILTLSFPLIIVASGALFRFNSISDRIQ